MATKLTTAQSELLASLQAQVEAATLHPGAYSRGLSPGTAGCHKTVAQSLLRLGLIEWKVGPLGTYVDVRHV